MKNILKLLVFGLFLISCSNTNRTEKKETIDQIVTLENDSFNYHGEKDITFERFKMTYTDKGSVYIFNSSDNKLTIEMINVMDSILSDSSLVYFGDFIMSNSDTLKSTEGNIYYLKLMKGVDF